MNARGLTRFGLPLVFVLATACGGSDDGPRQPLAPPPVNPNLAVLDQGRLDIEIPGDGLNGLAPSRMASQAGISVPCERLIFLFSWRTEGKQSIEFINVTQGKDEVQIGNGNEGVASVGGCAVVNAHNDGDDTVKLELRFVIAQTR